MNDRDCESCKKFSRIDPYETEGYCDAKRIWVDPQEGEDCKMHEFTLHSATKYKDGTPIMSEPEKVYCETANMSNQLDSLEQRVDDLSEEYDTVLRTHGDTLEEHLNRICELEHLYEKAIDYICTLRERVDQLTDKFVHNGSSFCGNCVHCHEYYVHYKEETVTRHSCDLTNEVVDPDDSSCSMFEPPF